MTPPVPPNDDTVLAEARVVEVAVQPALVQKAPGTRAVGETEVLSLNKVELTSEEAEQAIESLCTLIRFETVAATAVESGEYQRCAEWLREELLSLGFLDPVFFLPQAANHSPVVVAVWKGRDSTLPVLLLNSHYDVVPAVAADWHADTPPFAGVRRDQNIYGRGAQDMKCVCLQYIHALRKLHALQPDWIPQRDIVLSFVPDEEVGGSGMAALLQSQYFNQQLPGIALALDEGLASTTDTFSVFYGERLPWWVEVTAHGPTGHGSRFIENTAVEQLIALAQKALEFRQQQRALLGLDDHSNCAHAVAAANRAKKPTINQKTLGDVTSLNITTLQAGVRAGNTFAYNCVPPQASCSLDIRISPHTAPSEISDMLNTWCRECSSSPPSSSSGDSSPPNKPTMEWSYLKEGNALQEHSTTSTDGRVNPWYAVLERTLNENCGISVEPQVFPAATDSRFLRALGVNALGFSPMRNCPILLHEINEYIPESVFVEGIGVYVSLLYALGSYKEPEDSAKPTEAVDPSVKLAN